VQAYVHYHNKFRPHQGLGNRPVGVSENPPEASATEVGSIGCQRWLGGLLKHYERRAA